MVPGGGDAGRRNGCRQRARRAPSRPAISSRAPWTTALSTRRAAGRGAIADPAGRHPLRLCRVQPPRRRLRDGDGAGGAGDRGRRHRRRRVSASAVPRHCRAASPRPRRRWRGETPGEAVFRDAAAAAAAAIDPLEDPQTDARYRRELVAAMVVSRAEAGLRMSELGRHHADHQRAELCAAAGAAAHPARCDPRRLRPDRHPYGLRARRLRRLHGAARRRAGARLPDVRGAGAGKRDPHRRGAGARRRAAPAAARLHDTSRRCNAASAPRAS